MHGYCTFGGSTVTELPQWEHTKAKCSSNPPAGATLGAPQCGQIVCAPVLAGRKIRCAARALISVARPRVYVEWVEMRDRVLQPRNDIGCG